LTKENGELHAHVSSLTQNNHDLAQDNERIKHELTQANEQIASLQLNNGPSTGAENQAYYQDANNYQQQEEAYNGYTEEQFQNVDNGEAQEPKLEAENEY